MERKPAKPTITATHHPRSVKTGSAAKNQIPISDHEATLRCVRHELAITCGSLGIQLPATFRTTGRSGSASASSSGSGGVQFREPQGQPLPSKQEPEAPQAKPYDPPPQLPPHEIE